MRLLTIAVFMVFSCFSHAQEKQPIPAFGVLPPTEKELRDHPQNTRSEIPDGYILPNQYDLSNEIPVAEDQGFQSNCGVWAIVYTLKSYQEKVRNNWAYNTSTLFSPAFIYNIEMQKLGINCNFGLTLDQVFDDLKQYGALSLSDFPYNATDPLGCLKNPVPDPFQNQLLMEKARANATITYSPVSTRFKDDIKYHISRNRPVAVHLVIDSAFIKEGYEKQLKYIYNPDATTAKPIKHALVCIGYNDDTKEFKLVNSWGTSWGTNGMVYIPYEKFYKLVSIQRRLDDFIAPALVFNKTLKEEIGKIDKSDSILNKPIRSWFKKGYYRKFGNLKAGLVYLNRKKKQIIVRYSDQAGGRIISETRFNLNDSKTFYFSDRKVTFTFTDIGSAGSPFSFKGPAVFFTVQFEEQAYDPNIEGVLDKFR